MILVSLFDLYLYRQTNEGCMTQNARTAPVPVFL